ncbi:hypothetical protein CIB84_016924, partial [Bambusicola thoracicus]
MEPCRLLLLLLLLAPCGRGWALSGHAPAEETTRTDGPSVRPDRTRMGMGRDCWGPDPLSPPAKEDFNPRTDTDRTANCVNKCRDDGNCRSRGKCYGIVCPFQCLQLVRAILDTHAQKKVPHTIGCCNSTCSSDTDCPNHLRCCQSMRRIPGVSISLALT